MSSKKCRRRFINLFIRPKQPATGTEAPESSEPTGAASHPADLTAATQDLPQTLPDESDDCCDRRRTEARYVHAYTLLKDVLQGYPGCFGTFDFELSEEPEHFDDATFKRKLNDLLKSRQTSIQDKSKWTKVKDIIGSIYTASSPFAKTFLQVASSSQSVCRDLPIYAS